MPHQTPSKPLQLLACCLALVFSAPIPHSGAADAAPDAAATASDARHAEAEAAYDQAIARDPRSLKDRIGRGYVRAWQRKFDAAVEDFRAALAIEPRNLEAQNGLGYTLAWAGRFGEAETAFRRSQSLEASDFDSAKGLAYVALWRGDGRTAANRFGTLVEGNPKQAELWVGLGNSHRLLGDESGAERAYRRALEVEPGRPDATAALSASGERPQPVAGEPSRGSRRFDLTVLAGRTDFGNGTSSTGLRFAQLAAQATESIRVWAIFDSGLTRDNAALAASNVNADAYYLGGLIRYGAHGSSLEVGTRDLGNGTDQSMVRAEQVYFADSGWIPKIGFWYGKASALSSELTLHAGISVPLGESLRIEPTVYRARNAAGERETRGLLFAEYRFPNSATLGLGFADGSRSNVVAGSTESRREVLLHAGMPLGERLRAALQARRESGAGQPDNDLLALGLTVTF